METRVIPNDTIKEDYYDDLSQLSLGIVYDSNKGIIAAVDDNDSWSGLYKDEGDDQKNPQKRIEYYLRRMIVKEHYYYDLPILKIRNPVFWDNVFKQYTDDGWNNPTLAPVSKPSLIGPNKFKVTR